MDAKRLEFFLLSPEQHQRIQEYQRNKCGICGKALTGPHSKVLDHRHAPDGLVRGELCFLCNKALGFFKDSPELLQAALRYLEHPPALTALGHSHCGLPGRVGTKKQRQLLRRLKAAGGFPPADCCRPNSGTITE